MIKEMTQDQFNALAAKHYAKQCKVNPSYRDHVRYINALGDATCQVEMEKEYHLLNVSVYLKGRDYLASLNK